MNTIINEVNRGLLNEALENETPLIRVRKFLDILQYRRNDMIKYKKQLDSCKLELKLLIETYTNITETSVFSQQTIVSMHDKYNDFKELEIKYNKTKKNVENIQRLINGINITSYITVILEEFKKP